MVKKKKIEKGIKSINKKIKEHEEKIKRFSEKDDLVIGYWKGEIERFEKERKKKYKKLESGSLSR